MGSYANSGQSQMQQPYFGPQRRLFGMEIAAPNQAVWCGLGLIFFEMMGILALALWDVSLAHDSQERGYSLVVVINIIFCLSFVLSGVFFVRRPDLYVFLLGSAYVMFLFAWAFLSKCSSWIYIHLAK